MFWKEMEVSEGGPEPGGQCMRADTAWWSDMCVSGVTRVASKTLAKLLEHIMWSMRVWL